MGEDGTIVRDAGVFKNGEEVTLTLPGTVVSDHSRLEIPEETRFVLKMARDGSRKTLIDAIDRVIEDFNRRRMDLPDGFFDRKTQFVVNGAAFETLLSTNPMIRWS